MRFLAVATAHHEEIAFRLYFFTSYNNLESSVKAVLVDQRRATRMARDGKKIVIEMEVHRIFGDEAKNYPDGLKIGWIAFDWDNQKNRVLFDAHPPKGPHFHIDHESVEISCEWDSIDRAERFFLKLVSKHFNVYLGGLV